MNLAFYKICCSTSARVGVGYSTIDSRSCEATITGLLSCLQTLVIRSCTVGICSSGISTPRSPRATMIPSEATTISSSFWRDSKFSIFAKTLIDLKIKRKVQSPVASYITHISLFDKLNKNYDIQEKKIVA